MLDIKHNEVGELKQTVKSAHALAAFGAEGRTRRVYAGVYAARLGKREI